MIALLGYALPQTWLVHTNEINAGTYPDLIAGVRGPLLSHFCTPALESSRAFPAGEPR